MILASEYRWSSEGTGIEVETFFGGNQCSDAITGCGCPTEARQSGERGLNCSCGYLGTLLKSLEVPLRSLAAIHSRPHVCLTSRDASNWVGFKIIPVNILCSVAYTQIPVWHRSKLKTLKWITLPCLVVTSIWVKMAMFVKLQWNPESQLLRNNFQELGFYLFRVHAGYDLAYNEWRVSRPSRAASTENWGAQGNRCPHVLGREAVWKGS